MDITDAFWLASDHIVELLDDEATAKHWGALLESPRRRHGDRAVVRAMARRERTGAEVFPVL